MRPPQWHDLPHGSILALRDRAIFTDRKVFLTMPPRTEIPRHTETAKESSTQTSTDHNELRRQLLQNDQTQAAPSRGEKVTFINTTQGDRQVPTKDDSPSAPSNGKIMTMKRRDPEAVGSAEAKGKEVRENRERIKQNNGLRRGESKIVTAQEKEEAKKLYNERFTKIKEYKEQVNNFLKSNRNDPDVSP
jgi:hypothetical protein